MAALCLKATLIPSLEGTRTKALFAHVLSLFDTPFLFLDFSTVCLLEAN